MVILCIRGHILNKKSVYENVNYSFRGHILTKLQNKNCIFL